MDRKFVNRVAACALVLGAVGLAAASSAEARPRPGQRSARSAFQLFSAANSEVLINRVYCGIRAKGEMCTDVTGSPTLGGGSWPRGSGDQYVFNSGLQVTATISPTAVFGGTGSSWAGDTVGTWFMDPTGGLNSGEQITEIFSSAATRFSAADGDANWPSAAYVKDTTLYNSVLIGRRTVGQQDLWWRYWDGNPNQTAGRGHPAGILAETRILGWNFPSGNEDIAYFITRFFNITADGSTAAGRAMYDGLARYGYTTAEIDEIAAIGTRFQRLNEAKFAIVIPDTGYTLDNAFAAIFTDDDEADFEKNFPTVFLPFNMAATYASDWTGLANWSYPENIFRTPFAVAPGLVGIKFLKTPTNPLTGLEFGLTIWSATSNGPPFDDAESIQQQYRNHRGTNDPALGDWPCTVSDPPGRQLCGLPTVPRDARYFASSGPFDMNPGESQVFVTARVFAAGVASAVTPWIGAPSPAMLPGTPPGPGRLTTGQDSVRNIDRAAGWVSYSDANADGRITQYEVTTVPQSLLHKSLVAQAIFDSRFLLPSAPESPNFFLVPGDDQVTVVWQASSTEQIGDPYFQAAGDPSSPLYDPNYREKDVEGYRIWRGRTPSQMVLIAQFDYDATTFPDANGTLYNSGYGTQCAPELGLTTSCPTFPNEVPLASQEGVQPGIVQVTSRVITASGNVQILVADTAVSGGELCAGARCPGLTDTGVPFVYVDTDARDGFRYYYAVTAFDVNSVGSVGLGNTSLESGRVPRQVTPRASSGQEVVGNAVTQLIGSDGSVLDAGASMPAINATTGIFGGPMPATNGLDFEFASFLPQLVDSGSVTITIDSIVPGGSFDPGLGQTVTPTTWYFSRQAGSVTGSFTFQTTAFGQDGDVVRTGSANFPASGYGQAAASRFGGDSTFLAFATTTVEVPGIWGLTSKGRGDANDVPADGPSNGPRWWVGAGNEDISDPNGLNCPVVGGGFACPSTGNALTDLSRNAGQISDVDLFGIQSYLTIGSTSPMRLVEGITSNVMRTADFKVYWGTNGAVDSVVDVTHKVRVPFAPNIRASWGILNDSSFTNTPAAGTTDQSNAKLTFSDIYCVGPSPQLIVSTGTNSACNRTGARPVAENAFLMNHAILSPVAFRSGTNAATVTMTTNGNGFIFYLAGYFTLMRMAALPAAGTVWNYRTYTGYITGRTGTYAFSEHVRQAPIPGLRARITYSGSTLDVTTSERRFVLKISAKDDLIAETFFLKKARTHGIPVPTVYLSDTTRTVIPFEYLFLEYINGVNANDAPLPLQLKAAQEFGRQLP